MTAIVTLTETVHTMFDTDTFSREVSQLPFQMPILTVGKFVKVLDFGFG